MLVSLFTDASWSPESKTAGYGIWARSERGRVYNGGGLPVYIEQSHIAELMAAVEGIIMCLKQPICEPGDQILLQSDCKALEPYIRTGGLYIREGNRLDNWIRNNSILRQRIKDVSEEMQDQQIGLRFKHVRGHQANVTTRNYVNNLCDKLANQGRKKALVHLSTHDPDRRAYIGLRCYPEDKLVMDKVLPHDGEGAKRNRTVDFSKVD